MVEIAVQTHTIANNPNSNRILTIYFFRRRVQPMLSVA